MTEAAKKKKKNLQKYGREEIKADCIGIVGEFILDPDCGQNPEYAADQCTPTCGQNFAAKEIKKSLLALRSEKVDNVG
jgi:hypothetical protein